MSGSAFIPSAGDISVKQKIPGVPSLLYVTIFPTTVSFLVLLKAKIKSRGEVLKDEDLFPVTPNSLVNSSLQFNFQKTEMHPLNANPSTTKKNPHSRGLKGFACNQL